MYRNISPSYGRPTIPCSGGVRVRIGFGNGIAAVLAVVCVAVMLPLITRAQTQTTISVPAGSGQFGSSITVLPNGNFVVTDPGYDAGATLNLGAAHLYSPTGTLISTLTGSSANNQVGSAGVVVLTNGNFLILSPGWDNGAATNAGAVTWASGTTGVSGVVSAANSIVGSTASDGVGSSIARVRALTNGNYIVATSNWDNGATANVGAVTWGNGTTGTSGVISATNSIIGSTLNDQVGSAQLILLSNGNYVLASPNWNNGAITDAGAVTWCSGTAGCVGTVSASNSLVGSTASDQVGDAGGLGSVTALTNGNYVVRTSSWDNGAVANVGAVTWGNGTTGAKGAITAANSLIGSTAGDGAGNVVALNNGNYVVYNQFWNNGAIAYAGSVTWGNGGGGTVGPVSAANSLVGTTAYEQVGSGGVSALANGNYVVCTPAWDNGAAVNAGAVTWASGTAGVVGAITTSNSLVGTASGDQVGNSGVGVLTNGNYVVRSTAWDDGAVSDVGAATWGNGSTGTIGTVSAANSLVGTTANDQVGSVVYALTNGNYVVASSQWDNGAAVNAGAATWGDGTSGVVGPVSALNSLVGPNSSTYIGQVTVLTNGNYVVRSTFWGDGVATNLGSVTWGNGATGTAGVVSAANSLVGSTTGDQVGGGMGGGVYALPNGNYVVASPSWDSGAVADAGAVTWGDGASGTFGTISASNSLVGTQANDQVGNITVLANGNYVVISSNWDNGTTQDAGAVTWGNGVSGTTGEITSTNSVLGSTAFAGGGFRAVLNLTNGQILIGNPSVNAMVIFVPTAPTAAPASIEGRVLSSSGRPIPGASVTITDESGRSRTVRTSTFGYFRIYGVRVGESYIISASAKRFRFESVLLNISEDVTGLRLSPLDN